MVQTQQRTAGKIAGWLFGSLLVALGMLNLWLIHPVPGISYMILGVVYMPPVDRYAWNKFSLKIPGWAKVILGIAVMWFTLGISELAERYGL